MLRTPRSPFFKLFKNLQVVGYREKSKLHLYYVLRFENGGTQTHFFAISCKFFYIKFTAIHNN